MTFSIVFSWFNFFGYCNKWWVDDVNSSGPGSGDWLLAVATSLSSCSSRLCIVCACVCAWELSAWHSASAAAARERERGRVLASLGATCCLGNWGEREKTGFSLTKSPCESQLRCTILESERLNSFLSCKSSCITTKYALSCVSLFSSHCAHIECAPLSSSSHTRLQKDYLCVIVEL